MSAKHTPGPWRATTFSSVVGCVITAQPDPKKNTFNIGSIHGGRSVEESHANAKLVAAAPDLLEALQVIIDHVGLKHSMCNFKGNHIEDHIRKIIKKATT